MTTPPPPRLDPATGQPLPAEPSPVTEQKKLLAPVWHTVVIVFILLANSALTAWVTSRLATQRSQSITDRGRIVQYLFTIAFEFFLLFLVWIGLRLKGTRIRDLIGGRWNSPEAALIDFCIAIGFWLVSTIVLGGLGFVMGLSRGLQAEEAKKLAEFLGPHSLPALGVFILLSTVAGFVEEIIFRGYLQGQLGFLTGNVYAGLLLSAAAFGSSHAYEGPRRMILIFVFGTMFGFLALWRKSLRPGMIAHALYDSVAGAALYFVARHGFPSIP